MPANIILYGFYSKRSTLGHYQKISKNEQFKPKFEKLSPKMIAYNFFTAKYTKTKFSYFNLVLISVS